MYGETVHEEGNGGGTPTGPVIMAMAAPSIPGPSAATCRLIRQFATIALTGMREQSDQMPERAFHINIVGSTS